MKHISLFSGIGGFDLAAQWAGWDNLASCEINPFGRRVLSHYWPEAYHHDDIKTLTGEKIEHEAQKRYGPDWRADGVILSGGFPCQPYSLAGKRLGKEDERHLWPEMCRIIREIKPDWIVGENVFGLINWSNGLVFNEVQTDLEAAGYEVQAFVLPACAADAPHRRDRVWIVANAVSCTKRSSGKSGSIESNRGEDYIQSSKWGSEAELNIRSSSFSRSITNTNGAPTKHTIQTGRNLPTSESGERITSNANCNGQQRSNGKHEVNASERWQYAQRDTIEGAEYGTTTDAHGERLQQKRPDRKLGRERLSEPDTQNNGADWQNFPSQSPVCTRDDGVSAGLDAITFPKWRNESIKAAGNAIVPQIAFRIFQTINDFTQHNTHGTQFEQTNASARARE